MKSYNPFKMWGSWIGMIVIPIIYAIMMSLNTVLLPGQTMEPWYMQFCRIRTYNPFESGMFFIIIGSFLIGWGVHSLIRKLR